MSRKLLLLFALLPLWAASDPDFFRIKDMGISLRKPHSWQFISAADAQRSRKYQIASSVGPVSATRITNRSFTVCQLTKYPFEESREEPNPAVSITIQSLPDSKGLQTPKGFAKAAITSLKILYHDIDFEKFLDPVRVGELDGVRWVFAASIDPSIYAGRLHVEQIFLVQGKIGICITYQAGTSQMAEVRPEFDAIKASFRIPKRPSEPLPVAP